ncbi:MAG TPA: penicillin acylase family protein [Candidatus Saccharimonadales bacterium]|nr:penicillin acylase family protein [Candidatus Saccharimonadales bacterium]
MRLARRTLGGVLVLVLVVVVAGIGLLGSIAARSLPQVNGTLRIAGLQSSVTVIRDAAGVAQIYADSPHDLFMAQGYVHAQDRLWQMEVWRHISSGRLSELFGPSELKTDEFIRMLGWRQSAQADLDAVSPEVRSALDAYTAGVNAYMDAHRGNLGLPFVIEGLKLGQGGLGGYTPEPWTDLDSVAWAKVQSWNLDGNFDSEVFRLLADAKLGDPKRTDTLLPAYPSDGPVIVGGTAGGTGTPAAGNAAGTPAAAGAAKIPGTGGAAMTPAGSAAASTAPTGAPQPLTPAEAAAWQSLAETSREPSLIAGLDGGEGLVADHGIGSNNWVVAPRLSATGHALLANDPHLGISMPSLWYMNGLHCRVVSAACPFDVVGVSFPGVPAVVLGHNARIAWGATNANPDVEDLYAETVDPRNPTHYLFKGQSIPFGTRIETIKVAGAPDVTLTIRSTGHGPIVNDVDPELRSQTTLYALHWASTIAPEHTIDAIFGLNTASNFADFRASLANYGSPSQNFVYADVDGHIGYEMPGYVPIRPAGDLGDRPVSGSDGQHEWLGAVPYDQLPHVEDPPSGMIVTANNEIVRPSAALFLSQEYDPGYRAGRILALLGQDARNGGVTLDDMSAIENDVLVPRAAKIVPFLADATPATADGRTVLSRILAWNDQCDLESLGCAAYMTFEYRVLRDLFDDDLGPTLARDYVGTTMSWQALIDLLGKPNDPFWDDVTTPQHETEADIVARALDEAGRELRGAMGDDARWTWGRLHTATFREPTLGSSGIGPLEWLFDSGPYPVAGAAGAVDNTYYQFSRAYPDPTDPTYQPVRLKGVFEVTNLPSYRQVIDMGSLDTARFVQTTGNGGNPFDQHYGDLIGDWLYGRLVPMWFSAAAVHDHAASTLTLSP